MSNTPSAWDVVEKAFPQSSSTNGRAKAQEDISNTQPLVGKTALIIDNALATRRALQEQLSMLGAQSIRFAATTADVYRSLEASDPDLIVCEYLLDDQRTGQQLLEELKTTNRLPWQTAFMMITGERSYNNVMGVVELEPDDYLIKPFTASQLSDRIIRLFTKKNALSLLFKTIHHKEFKSALSVVEPLKQKFPQYSTDIFKLQIQALVGAGESSQAEQLIKSMLIERPAPWMNMCLARIFCKRSEYLKAESELTIVTRERPEFLAAKDLLADVLWELNKPNDALNVLETVGSAGLSNTQRLRKLADLSIRINDPVRLKQYLHKVIERTQGTNMARVDDFVNLAGVYVAEGRVEDADRISMKMRQSIHSEDLEIGKMLINVKKIIKDLGPEQACEQMEKVLKAYELATNKPSPMIQVTMIEACFELGMTEHAYTHARQLTTRGAQKAVLDRLKSAIEKAKKAKT